MNPPRPAAAASSRRGWLAWTGILLFLGVFFFYPLGRVLLLGLDPAGLRGGPAGTPGLALRVLGFTFYQASLSTLLTLVLGLPAAFLFARFAFRGKAVLRGVTAIPFMLPTVVVAASFNALLGGRGWLNVLLVDRLELEYAPLNLVGTLGAILVAHVFYNTTIVIRLVGTALERVDPHLEQAARSLGAAPLRVLRDVLLPTIRPALLASSLLVFIFDFTSFGVILLLGGTRSATLEVEIYRQALQLSNLPLAAQLSFLQLACTLLFSVFYSRLISRPGSPSAGRVPQPSPARAPRTWGGRQFQAGMACLLAAFFVLPLLSLPLRSVTRLETERGDRTQAEVGFTLQYYSELFINRRASVFYVPPVQALVNSLAYAAATVAFSLLLGFPAAVALARPGRLERLLDPLLMLPLGASAVTLGLGFILSFGRWLASPFFVPVAHTLIALPFVIRTLQPALASIRGAIARCRGDARCLPAQGLGDDRLAGRLPGDPGGRRFRLHRLAGRVRCHLAGHASRISHPAGGHRPLSQSPGRDQLWAGDGHGQPVDAGLRDRDPAAGKTAPAWNRRILIPAGLQPPGGGRKTRCLKCRTSTRNTRASPCSTGSPCAWERGRSSACSGLPAAGNPPCCASWPAWSRPKGAGCSGTGTT